MSLQVQIQEPKKLRDTVAERFELANLEFYIYICNPTQRLLLIIFYRVACQHALRANSKLM